MATNCQNAHFTTARWAYMIDFRDLRGRFRARVLRFAIDDGNYPATGGGF